VGQIATAVHGLFTIEDVHNFGAYYDKTLMAWNEKFQSNRAAVAALISRKGRDGERFCRMWEYYLLSCAGIFAHARSAWASSFCHRAAFAADIRAYDKGFALFFRQYVEPRLRQSLHMPAI
jgi:cyclopropane fatty-acyl-phospholipid synthase-like methyltransferase